MLLFCSIGNYTDVFKKPGTILFYGFIGLGVCFFIALLYALIFYGNNIEQKIHARPAVNLPPDYVLTADELYAAYKKNKIAADMKYKEKIVIVSGAVRSIREDIMGMPYVLLFIGDNEYLIGGVQCYFKKEDRHVLARLYRSQQVKIRGRVGDYTIGYVGIKDCVLQTIKNGQ